MKGRLSLALTVLIAIVGAVVGLNVAAPIVKPAKAYYVSPPYTFTVGTANSFIQTGDGAPVLVNDGTNVYLIGRDAPAAPGHPVIYRGTSWDNLTQIYTGTTDSSYTTANGERYWWNGGAWIDSNGKWYVVTHIEFDFGQTQPPLNDPPMKRIGLSSSTDKGQTWHYEGDIMTSDNSYNINNFQNYFDYGAGEPNLYVDNAGGYFYVWYLQFWSNTPGGNDWFSSLRVARAPISGHMAPGTWNYFYNGAWTQNALGGRSSDVLPNATSSAVVFSTYLNRFVLITTRLLPNNPVDGTYMATATDLSQQNWTNFHLLTTTSNHYNAITNSTGDATGSVGQSLRWYDTPGANSGTGPQYQYVTFGTGSQPALGMPQQYYPRYSVNDGSAYWDWTATPSYSSFSDNFPYSTPVGWTTYDGNWYESGGQLHVDSGTDNGAAVQNEWFDDLTYDIDVEISNTAGNAGVVFRNANNDYGVTNYRGYYAGFSGSQLILGKADNTSGTPIPFVYLATDPITASPNQFYHLKVVADAGRIQVFFNGAGTPSIDVIDNDFALGGIALHAYGTAAAFSNLSVVRDTNPGAYSLSNNFTNQQGFHYWRYQYTYDDINFSDMSWQTTTQQWNGPCAFNLVWAPSYIHPDCADSAVTWIAPQTGSVTVFGNPRKFASNGDGVNVKILQNGTQVWPTTGGWQLITDTTGVTHEVDLNVVAGDHIEFVVNKNVTNTGDATIWNPTIEYVYARIGVVANGHVYVKDGQLNGAWTDEGPGDSVSLSGDRIGIIGTDGHAYVKEGALNASWNDEASGMSQIWLSGDRIAVLGNDTHLYVKEGPLNAPWTDEGSGVIYAALTSERVAAFTSAGHLLVKDGALNSAWNDEASSVSNFSIAGTRIGVVIGGVVSVKDGALNAPWTTEASGQVSVALAENRIAVISNDQSLTINVKEGSLTAPWVVVGSGVNNVTLSGNRIAALGSNAIAWAREGPLANNNWVQESTGAIQITLPETRPT